MVAYKTKLLKAFLAGFGSAMCVAIYSLLEENLTKKYSVLILQGWSFFFGGIIMFFIFQAWKIHYSITWMGLLGIFVVIFIGNIAAFNAFMSELAIIGPEKGILYGFNEAIVAASIGYLFLGNNFTLWNLSGYFCFF